MFPPLRTHTHTISHTGGSEGSCECLPRQHVACGDLRLVLASVLSLHDVLCSHTYKFTYTELCRSIPHDRTPSQRIPAQRRLWAVQLCLGLGQPQGGSHGRQIGSRCLGQMLQDSPFYRADPPTPARAGIVCVRPTHASYASTGSSLARLGSVCGRSHEIAQLEECPRIVQQRDDLLCAPACVCEWGLGQHWNAYRDECLL